MFDWESGFFALLSLFEPQNTEGVAATRFNEYDEEREHFGQKERGN